MKKLSTALLASCMVAATAFAADSEAQFSPAAIRAHITFLADDLLEGRETGSRGYDIGARYIASQFAALGLQPAGLNGDWFIPAKFHVNTIVDAAITVSGPAGSQRWENGTEVMMRSNALVQMQDVEADAVFVGYGIDEPRTGINNYENLDVRGKIVVAFDDFPKGMESELGAYLGDSQAETAARHGAIGLVRIDTIQSEKASPWARRVQTLNARRMTWMTPTGEPYVSSPAVFAGIQLNLAAAEALFAGAPTSFADIRKTADAVGGNPPGFPLKTKIRVQRNSNWDQVSSSSIAAMIPGSDPQLKDEYVVLMGHADHIGISLGRQEDQINNGALDNAAGIATLLEVARAFATSPEKPRRSIIFFASTGEEKGLLGADFFAHYPTVPIDKIVGLVDLDMPILLYDFTDVTAFGADHSTMGQIVRRAGEKMNVAVAPDPMPEEGIFTRSDHYMFVRQGVPAIMLATGRANGGEAAWADYLANHYHQPSDDLSQNINWEAGAKFANLNYLITREMADSDERPLWIEGDFFGDVFAPKQPRAPK
ncbi:MAG: M20/M25/M40 family metallo-hydrolase [Pseudomonadota bacterium]